MATEAQCEKCVNKKDCPILYAINTEHIKVDKILREKCISFEEE